MAATENYNKLTSIDNGKTGSIFAAYQAVLAEESNTDLERKLCIIILNKKLVSAIFQQ